MQKPGRIAIVIHPADGHVPEYAVLFEKAFAEAGFATVTLGPDFEAIRRSNLGAARSPDALHHLWTPRFPTGKRLIHWLDVARGVRELEARTGEKVSLVFFPHLYPFLCGAAHWWAHVVLRLLFRYRWSGMLTHPVPRPAYNYGCSGIVVLDESHVPAQTPVPYFVVPDTSETFLSTSETDVVRKVREQARGRKILSLPGNPGPRKSLALFLELSTRPELSDVFFLIYGKLRRNHIDPALEAAYQDHIDRPRENLLVLPGEQEPADFDGLLALSDVLFLVYDRHPYSSNLMTKAAIFEKPVVVSRTSPVMWSRVLKFGLGISIDVPPTPEELDRLKGLLKGTRTEPFKFAEYREAHSLPRFFEAVRDFTKRVL